MYKFCHRSLTFSGFMVFSRQLGTQRLNHDDVSDLQDVALERGPSSLLKIPSWMTVQNVFSQSELVFFPEFPVVLNSLKSDFPVLN